MLTTSLEAPPTRLARQALRMGYPLFMLLGVNGAALALLHGGASKLWLGGLLMAAIGVSFLAERAIPYEPDWNRPHGDVGRDLVHFVVNEASNILSILALPLLSGVVTVRDAWPHEWPFVLQVLLAVLVFDLGVTLTHWLSHRAPALWRLHAVHHSVKRFYGFNGLMKHPLHQALEMTVGVAPLLLIGLPSSIASALAALSCVQLLMQHSNADYTVGPLKYLLALNAGHRFHHLKWAGVGDVNFGLFTNIWDYLLGTWAYTPEKRFSSDELGIAKEPGFPVGYWAQLLKPFQGSKEA
ncbi:sterol desaturase family protein [Myxococcus xanthus]|jgi:sterol desaturase/sphingolipid hydroxylase (fatty acid hydroxylase superfamily)|uniref:Sterol desaturase family protein n=1 Tax=Myxococcus xanthus TaxID=34 RepID=A0A7Y4MTA7_MYXXA|nr:sterol desaturase family protein [Myxococcus xanthus]NOJ80383.1 sterol desaturase family protein [Myxococcus xanthus]NOJ84916.1 sterol desaturase family protein [Myxococcus xanthus]